MRSVTVPLLACLLLAFSVLASPLRSKQLNFLDKRQNNLCPKSQSFLTNTAYRGPNPSPDTAAAYLAFSTFASNARNAATPANFTRVYVNQQATNTLTTDDSVRATNLSAYTVSQCADVCTKLQPNCKGFNMYYQRVPKNDTKYNDLSCTVPPNSTTLMTCQILQRLFPAASRLNNTGYTRNGFQSVIAGSNGYVWSGACQQPVSSSTPYTGPVPSPDTPAAFKNFTTFANKANTATTPSGFRRVFVNQTAAAAYSSDGSDYLSTNEFASYNVTQCATSCRATQGCKSFNIYYQRRPRVFEANAGDTYCSLPSASYTHVICDLHASVISSSNFTDPTARSGYVRNGFEYDYAGSNGYVLV